MLEGFNYAGGLQLNFFSTSTLEKDVLDDKTLDLQRQGRNVLRLLMSGWNQDWRSILSYETFHAVFVARQHQLTRAVRQAFQEGMHHLFTQLENNELSQEQQNQAELFISNCLTYLAFFDPTPFESYAIPQLIKHDDVAHWEMVNYTVTPIELTPTYGFKKLYIEDPDRVFAYGLEPINHAKAHPHLVFMGTAYPAGQGFFTMVNTDLEAFETAGKKLYRTGRDRIMQWLDAQDKKVHVCGTSLGGALSLILALDQGDKLSRVDALNPPGLYPSWRKSRYDRWDGFTEKPDVYIQKQGNDPVSMFGVWKEDWHILKVTPPKDKQGPNGVTDHALNYAGLQGTTFVGVDTKKDNEEHQSRTFWLYILLRSLAYYLLLVPLRYLVIPVLRFIFDNKLHLTLLISFIHFSEVTALTALVITNLLIEVLQYANDLIFGSKTSRLSSLLARFEQYPGLHFALSLITASTAVAVLLSFVVFPELAPILTLIAAIPLSIRILKAIIDTCCTLFGFNDPKAADCHHENLPRDSGLDIYDKAKREVLKQKPFIPDTNHEHTHGFFKQATPTTREVLLNSQDTDSQDETITIKAY